MKFLNKLDLHFGKKGLYHFKKYNKKSSRFIEGIFVIHDSLIKVIANKTTSFGKLFGEEMGVIEEEIKKEDFVLLTRYIPNIRKSQLSIGINPFKYSLIDPTKNGRDRYICKKNPYYYMENLWKKIMKKKHGKSLDLLVYY